MPAPPQRIRSASVPCGHQLDLQLAAQVLLLEVLVLAHVARGHLLDLARLQQDPESVLVGAAVVADDREILDALLVDRADEVLRIPTETKSTAQDRRPVLDIEDGSLGTREHLVHGPSPPGTVDIWAFIAHGTGGGGLCPSSSRGGPQAVWGPHDSPSDTSPRGAAKRGLFGQALQ